MLSQRKTNQINFKAITPISQEKFKAFIEALSQIDNTVASVQIFSKGEGKHLAVKVKGKVLCLWV